MTMPSFDSKSAKWVPYFMISFDGVLELPDFTVEEARSLISNRFGSGCDIHSVIRHSEWRGLVTVSNNKIALTEWGRGYARECIETYSNGSEKFRPIKSPENTAPAAAVAKVAEVIPLPVRAAAPASADFAPSEYDNADPYLRSVAAASTKCYSGFRANDRVCAACPLARWCAEAREASMARAAQELEREFLAEEARLAAEEAARVAAEEAARVAAEEARALEEARVAAEEARRAASPSHVTLTPVYEVPVSAPGSAPTSTPIVAAFDAICTNCRSTIQRGTNAVHFPGRGLFHPHCG